LLVFDEVQTGVGRTGRFWAYEHAGVEPDVMTLAKGLAGGVPIGALVCRDEVAKGFEPGSHASTFGGNPLATAAGLATLKVILEDRLVERAAAAGERLVGRLRDVAARRPAVRDVRGRGLLVGIEVAGAAKDLVDAMREKCRVLVAAAGENVVRFVPPLIVTNDQIDRAVDALDACLA
jgi:acetylornithine/succinyldiaminopimelate/putrescine aminotransferase